MVHMRVVVMLEAGADVGQVAAGLRALGADDVRGPQPSLPDVVVATFPTDAPAALRDIGALRGVRVAEVDALRGPA
jgi:hypothetical protein